MKEADFVKFQEATFETIRKLTSSKGAEYKQANDDQLFNFKNNAARNGLQPTTSLFNALDKHFNSVVTFVKDQQLGRKRAYSEPIEGRLDDIILYCILLKALVSDMRADGTLVCEEPIAPSVSFSQLAGWTRFKVDFSGQGDFAIALHDRFGLDFKKLFCVHTPPPCFFPNANLDFALYYNRGPEENLVAGQPELIPPKLVGAAIGDALFLAPAEIGPVPPGV
jgi:hypothetical protein